jgi:hypothetical protein
MVSYLNTRDLGIVYLAHQLDGQESINNRGGGCKSKGDVESSHTHKI